MNVILKSKQDTARDWLAAINSPSDWRSDRATKARNWLLEYGAAHKRDHFWSYTDPSLMNGEVEAVQIELPEFMGLELSDATKADETTYKIRNLADAEFTDFGGLVARAHEKGHRPFAEQVLADAEGFVIDVVGDAGVFTLDHSKWSGNYIRLNIAAGAKVTLIERVTKANQRVILIEADLADDAKFDHIRIAPKMDDRLMLQLFADLAASADFRSFNLVGASSFRRFESIVNLNGEGGHASIAGADLLEGKAFHDDTVYVTHNAENCTSRQVFKRVVAKDSQSIFQGKIYVQQGAQKTDGYQISQGLMLEDGGEALSKPELEIYADDVACSHGSTTSGLDETALFYLRSRGIPTDIAEKLLIRAFIDEAFDEVRDKALRTQLADLADLWIFGQTQ